MAALRRLWLPTCNVAQPSFTATLPSHGVCVVYTSSPVKPQLTVFALKADNQPAAPKQVFT